MVRRECGKLAVVLHQQYLLEGCTIVAVCGTTMPDDPHLLAWFNQVGLAGQLVQ